MEQLKQLAENQKHEEIAMLEGKDYDAYKCIALIKLGRFEEATKYCDNLSFEKAYIFYKQRNFKKCLKIIEKMGETSEKFKILKSQALYNTGRYNQAYDLLDSVSNEDEFMVNLEAMRSFAVLAHFYQTRLPGKFSLLKKDEIAKFRDFKNIKNKEIEEECVYNSTFKYLNDDALYLEKLNEAAKIDKSGLVDNQLANVIGNSADVNERHLNKCDKEILMNNMGLKEGFTNYSHYLNNFKQIGNDTYWPVNNYACYKKAAELNFTGINARISNGSEMLIILKAYIELKRKYNGEKYNKKAFVKRFDFELWNVIEILAMNKKEIQENKTRILAITKELDSGNK